MSRFNTKTKGSSKTTNKAGGHAYSLSPKQELLHGALTTFLDDKYYESSKERQERLVNLVDQAGADFAARLAVVARKEFHLRSVSHLLLGTIALNHSGDDLVKRAVVAATERPDDLTEFASYVLTNSDKGVLTKQSKRAIRNALLKFDAYQLAKYRGEGNAVSLVDLFNLSHPHGEHATEEQREAWDKLMSGELKNERTWESQISNATSDEERTKKWEEMVMEGSIGYMALLRNLNNLLKYDVSDEVISAAAQTLRDPERVKKSKQLPFRFYTAYMNVQGNRVLSDAVSEAMDISVSNAPTFPGKTLIAVDNSGSMMGSAIENASVLGAALTKANSGAEMILFNQQVIPFPVSGRTPVVDVVARIKEAPSGGTQTSLVFEYAKSTNVNYDRIIILSDNESWAERAMFHNNSVQAAYELYLKETGNDPHVFAIDIQGYGTVDIPQSRAHHLCGWSDRILDFIGKMENSESLIKYVESYEL